MPEELIQLTTFGIGEKNGGRGNTAPATGALSGCDISDPGRATEPSTGGRKAVPPGNGGGSRVLGPVTLSGRGMPKCGPVPTCGGAIGRGGGIPMNGGGGMPSGGRTGS